MTGGNSGSGNAYAYQVLSYAANGNILSQTDSVMGTWNYTYDTLNRLTGTVAGTLHEVSRGTDEISRDASMVTDPATSSSTMACARPGIGSDNARARSKTGFRARNIASTVPFLGIANQ